MTKKYMAPEAVKQDGEHVLNNSGMGETTLPDGIKGWCWGGFLLNWIWAIFNDTWIGLLSLIPGFGIIMCVILGFKGREWAWKNKRWQNINYFNQQQKKWSFWGFVIFPIFLILNIGLLIIASSLAR